MTESEWMTCDDPVRMIRYWSRETPPLGDLCPTPNTDRKLRLFACACCRQVWEGVKCGRRGCDDGFVTTHYGTTSDPRWRTDPCPDCRGTGKVGGLTDPRSRRAVEAAERHADGLVTAEELSKARSAAWEVIKPRPAGMPAHLAYAAANGPADVQHTIAAFTVVGANPHAAAQAALLRDIVGNPFRRVTLPSPDVQCPNCFGKGSVREDGPYTSRYGRVKCGRCSGGGKVRGFCPWLTWRDGTVPKLARAIYDARDFGQLPTLADALEEAGCPAEEACGRCGGKGGRVLNSTDAVRSAPGECPVCGLSGRVPHPLLEHLRGPGPHVLGCWALDVLAEKG
jgi:hypothetical protein